MKFLSSLLRQPRFAVPLFLLFLTAGYLMSRNIGLYPRVFADEWYYNDFSRLVPLHDAMVPSYLYFALFHLTNTCGSGFLECARLLNLVAFTAAAPFIYLVARQVCSHRIAVSVTLLSMLAPVNGYTAYFMPEASYFFCFWLFLWTTLRFHRNPDWQSLLQSATVLGLSAMVKMHALFLLPAYCVFIGYTAYQHRNEAGRSKWVVTALRWTLGAVLMASALRMGIAYLIAGKGGFSLLGTLYSGQATQADATNPSLLMLMRTLNNLRGHLLALSLLFSVPLASLILHFTRQGARAQATAPSRAIGVLALLILLSLLAVTAVFTGSMVGQNASETDARLHMRYYDFVFPLLLIWCASQVNGAPGASRKWIVAVPLVAVMAYAWCVLTRLYISSVVDCPEVDALAYRPDILAALSGISLLTLLVWWRDGRLGMRLFLFVFIPIYTLTGALHINKEFRRLLVPDEHVTAGQFAHLYLQPDERKHLTIVSADGSGLFKTRFFVDSPNVDILMLPHGSTIDRKELSKKTQWLLLIGDYQVPGTVISRIDPREFSLLQIGQERDSSRDIDFSLIGSKGYFRNISGMSQPESFGTWSMGKKVRLELVTALPDKAVVELTGHAFGPNIDEEFIVSAGAQSRRIRLGALEQKVTLEFDTDGKTNTIDIQVPHPVSPAALGQGSDTRELGLVLGKLKIRSRAGDEAAIP